jgi:2'-5' RNA ligase
MKDERGARIRLFFALWPDATARTGLRDARDGAVDQARLTHPDDLHLTLVLIGDVEPTRLPCIEAAADDVALAGFELVLEQLETWPRQRVLVASPNDPPPALFSLVSRLQQNLLICSVEPEPRRCRPHVTLARKAPKVPRRALNIPCSARELVLVRSGIGGRSSGGGYHRYCARGRCTGAAALPAPICSCSATSTLARLTAAPGGRGPATGLCSRRVRCGASRQGRVVEWVRVPPSWPLAAGLVSSLAAGTGNRPVDA